MSDADDVGGFWTSRQRYLGQNATTPTATPLRCTFSPNAVP